MILLFTTSSDSRPLYRRDLLNVCCEASGTFIRFGYDIDWIAENLRSRVQLRDTNDLEALIIYCEVTDTPERYYTYHPIRWATIANTYLEHKSATLELKLGNFFDYAKDNVSDVISEFQDYVLRSNDNPSQADRRNRRYMRTDRNWRLDYVSSNWLPLVRYVRRLNGLGGCYFFSVQRPENFGETPSFILNEYKFDQSRTAYIFKSGKSYEVSLYVIQ